MENRYKLMMSAKQSYREAEISELQPKMIVGTGIEADVRFREEDFFEPFLLVITLQEGKCQIECGNNVYLSAGDARKLMIAELDPGMQIVLKYRKSNVEVMTLFYTLDFDFYPHHYDRRIDLQGLSSVRIGGTGSCQIQLPHESVHDDSLLISRQGKQYLLLPEQTGNEVRINGNALSESTVLMPLDFLSVGPYSFCYQNQALYTDSGSDMILHGVSYADEKESQSWHTYPKFNRSTRIHEILPDEEIEILDPPSQPRKPDGNIIMKLFPSVAMLGVVVLLRGFMSTTSISYLLISAGTMGVGIITSVMSIITEKKDYKEETEKREEKYSAYIEEKKKVIEEARGQEIQILENRYYSVPKELDQIESFSPRLFEREMRDEDFLEVRLGTGLREAYRHISYKKQERIESTDTLIDIPGKMAEDYKMLKNAPVTMSLKETSMVGITGSRDALYHMLKLFTLDLASRHYYTEVQFLYCIGEEDIGRMSWLRMLPHVQNDLLHRRNVICDDESKGILLEYLYKEILNRNKENCMPRMIVFVYRDNGIQNHPVSALMQDAKEKGITFLYFNEHEEYLPKGCEYIIRMEDVLHGMKVQAADGTKAEVFTANVLEDAMLAKAVNKLAPIYCEEISLESTLTKSITFFEMMNIYGPEDIDVEENWASSEVYRSMAAPIGVKAKNQIVYLDLNEKHHGPHGLVAGTTGSGKSETLQSYILSMGLLFHPYDVSFVIIDFKGGGMVNQFRKLPHLVGAITNIDGKAMERSLLSIRAELKKRQEMFAEYQVNHIDAYIRLYKQGIAKKPLPHLILIVDEFAELKAEQPEFMKELISAARIGRSLGVHLILATQKPSGVVDPQIWSNSRFKLCLKVQTREDSNEVLKSPLAAEITEPGRAYLQVGNNEIFELFQSAYSGASARTEGAASKKKFSISRLDFAGRRTKIYEQKPEKSKEQSQTQLESVVAYLSEYCQKKQIAPLPYICLPPLGEVLTTDRWERPCELSEGLKAYVGILDDPSRQRQDELVMNVTQANTMIIGSSGNGKTNLLQTIIRSLTSQYTPEELNLYILDFGSMIFRNYESLHHVGGVVCSYEEEKCRNLFKLLSQEMEERKEKLVNAGVSSYASYLETGKGDLPQIVVVIDNLTALRELYLMDNDFLLPVCRDGIAVGISFVIANAQTSGIGYKYLSNFEQRIALFCNDTTEYGALFDSCRMRPDNLPGRCLIEREKVIYEAQTYLAFAGEKEVDRVNQILTYNQMQNECYPDSYARAIPEVPKDLTPEVLKRKFGCSPDCMRIPIGVDYDSIEPCVLDLSEKSILAISGQADRGRMQYVEYLCQTFAAQDIGVYILDDAAGTLSDHKEESNVCLYSQSAADIEEMLKDMEMELEERESSGSDSWEKPIILLIHNKNAVAAISEDRGLLSIYKHILSLCRSSRSCIIYTNLDNDAIAFNSPEVLKILKENRQFLVFANATDIKMVDIPSSFVRKNGKPLDKNEAFWINGNDISRLKVVRNEDIVRGGEKNECK